MSKKNVTLYNMIFPIWLLWLIPISWLVVMPANFGIDLLVIVLTMKHLKMQNIKQKAKSIIWKVWVLGFLADFLGTFAMYSVGLIDELFSYDTPIGKWWYEKLTNAVFYQPFESIYAFLWVTACVALTGFFIYLFNVKISLRKLDILQEEKKKLALSLAVFTAPYLFYLPTMWFF